MLFVIKEVVQKTLFYPWILEINTDKPIVAVLYYRQTYYLIIQCHQVVKPTAGVKKGKGTNTTVCLSNCIN